MTTRSKERNAGNGFSLISREKLLQLYSTMLKCRMIEERLPALSAQNGLAANRDGILGYEAAAVGVAIDLLPEDIVAASSRNLILNFIKGQPLATIFSSLFSSAVNPDPTVHLHQAANVAMAHQAARNGKIAVAFLDGAAAAPGFCHEAFTIASFHRLPILFVSYAGPAGQSSIAELALKAEAYGFPAVIVDAADVVAVYRVATEAITHARKGNGPTLIECVINGSEPRDPIRRMEVYLNHMGLFSEEWRRKVESSFKRKLNSAAATAPKM
jgi:pyruvate dehydrogenase E1 component alpha subunit